MAEERKNWIVKVIDWGFKEIWPLLLVYPFVQIVFQGISIYLIGWPTWSEAGLNTLAQPLKISGIVNGILTLILVILGLSVAARRLLQFNQQLKQQNKQINIQLESMKQQRFYDAVKLLGDDKEYLQLGALNVIRQVCTNEETAFFEESHAILKSYIEIKAKSNSMSPSENTRIEIQSKTVESALVTLTKILNKHDQQILKNKRIEKFKLIDFTGLNPETHLIFKSLRFSGCRLIDCRFTHATFDNVRFLAGSEDANPSDLTGTKFEGVTFANCCFGDANISGTDFGEAKGLSEKNLEKCHYQITKPPRNLPVGLLINRPYSGGDFSEDSLGVPKLNEIRACTDIEIAEFLTSNPHFAKHEMDNPNGENIKVLKVISVDPNDYNDKNVNN